MAVEWTWPPGWPMLGTSPKRERTTECGLPQSACCAMPCGACLVLRLVGRDAASFALPSTNVKPAYGGVGAAQVFPFFSADVGQIISEPATASTQDNKSAPMQSFLHVQSTFSHALLCPQRRTASPHLGVRPPTVAVLFHESQLSLSGLQHSSRKISIGIYNS